MRERFLDIVTLLARYVFEERRALDDEAAIIEELVADGYDPREVREAFEWLEQVAAAREGAGRVSVGGPDHSTRVLTPAEALKITPHAYGFLVRVRQLRLVDAAMLERILDRAMATETDEIGIEEIRAITALLLFDRSPRDLRGQLLDILDDRGARVYH